MIITSVKNKKITMHFFAFITVSLWALGYVMTRIAVEHFTSEALSFLRYLIAAVSLIAFAVIKKTRLPKLKDIPLFIFGGAIGLHLRLAN
jgi:drug/metabolite transporter (DMT)-like permease